MAATLDAVFDEIRAIQTEARQTGRWRLDDSVATLANDHPQDAKGLDRPEGVDGLKTEGFWRSHQVPFAEMATKPAHLKLLEAVDEELPARRTVR